MRFFHHYLIIFGFSYLYFSNSTTPPHPTLYDPIYTRTLRVTFYVKTKT